MDTFIRIYCVVDACVACQRCVLHYPHVCLEKANKLSNNLARSAPRVRAARAAAAERNCSYVTDADSAISSAPHHHGVA